MNKTDKVRLRVLNHSLKIENELSHILKILFNIESDDNKSLGFKGSALSFKNKVDLLSDLGFIEKDIYMRFQLFMEIRNKFIHNINIDTMTKAIEQSDNLKLIKKLSEKNNYPNTLNEEEIYLHLFDTLSNELWDNILNSGIKIIENLITHEKTINAAERTKLSEVNLAHLIESIRETSKEINKSLSDQDYESKIGDLFGVAVLKKFIEKTGFNFPIKGDNL